MTGQRRDGERDAEEGRVEAAPRGIGEVGVGQEQPSAVAEHEGHDHAEHAGEERRRGRSCARR